MREGEGIDIFYAHLITFFVRLSIIKRFTFLYQHTFSFQISIFQKLHWSHLDKINLLLVIDTAGCWKWRCYSLLYCFYWLRTCFSLCHPAFGCTRDTQRWKYTHVDMNACIFRDKHMKCNWKYSVRLVLIFSFNVSNKKYTIQL